MNWERNVRRMVETLSKEKRGGGRGGLKRVDFVEGESEVVCSAVQKTLQHLRSAHGVHKDGGKGSCGVLNSVEIQNTTVECWISQHDSSVICSGLSTEGRFERGTWT